MRTLILSLLLVFSQVLVAQDLSVIRDIYKEVNAQIAACSDNGESDEPNCALYSNVVVVNENGNSWRAVGAYQKTIRYWYTDEPQFSQVDDKPEAVLSKIEVTVSSTYNVYEEYLFQNGELIFFYQKFDYFGESVQEARFYYQLGKLIDFKQKLPDEDVEVQFSREDSARVQKTSEDLVQLFLLSMD